MHLILLIKKCNSLDNSGPDICCTRTKDLSLLSLLFLPPSSLSSHLSTLISLPLSLSLSLSLSLNSTYSLLSLSLPFFLLSAFLLSLSLLSLSPLSLSLLFCVTGFVSNPTTAFIHLSLYQITFKATALPFPFLNHSIFIFSYSHLNCGFTIIQLVRQSAFGKAHSSNKDPHVPTAKEANVHKKSLFSSGSILSWQTFQLKMEEDQRPKPMNYGLFLFHLEIFLNSWPTNDLQMHEKMTRNKEEILDFSLNMNTTLFYVRYEKYWCNYALKEISFLFANAFSCKQKSKREQKDEG